MSRHQSRELALQVLFHVDVGHADPEEALAQAKERDGAEGADLEYARELVLGTWAEREELDREITRLAKDWKLERMANIDRNVLRLAIHEVRAHPDVPTAVIADEAVELAKTFSTAESGKFVNGILGTLLRERAEVAKHAAKDVSRS